MILQLAVMGKLVPQDPADEPASVLLQRIAAEKDRLIRAGTIKRPKPLPAIRDDEKPFELPHGWEWVRFGTATINRDAERIPLSTDIRMGMQGSYDYYGASGIIDKVNDFLFDKSLLLIGEDGANLINRSTPIAFIATGKYWVNNHAHVIDGISVDFLKYIEIYINSISLEPYVTGTAQPKMNQAKLNSIILSLPPIEEQKRIVAKVDSLMVLCDKLETLQQQRQQLDPMTQTAVLDALLPSPLAGEGLGMGGASAWQRLNQHMTTLFHTPESVKALRETILQLAVMGKLVPQDPNDEPAAVLLQHIAAEKDRLIQEGKIKRQKPLPAIRDDEKPFELPNGWEWARFREIGEFGRGKSKHRPRNDPKLFTPSIYPLIQTGEVARAINTINEYHSRYSEFGLLQSKLWPKGTLCITIAANIADSAILGFDACFPDSVVGYVPYKPLSDAKYIFFFMKTARANLLKFAPSTAQKNINLEILESVLIPFPPLAEQQRIVAKVDSLMALCDKLETRLQAARETAGLFASEAVNMTTSTAEVAA